MTAEPPPEGVLRRCKSVTNAEAIVKEENFIRSQQPDSPCHRPKDSLFSWSSGFTNFTGFANLAYFLLLLGGLRLCLENLLKYGIRVDPTQWYVVLANQEGQFPSIYSSILLLLGTPLQAVLILGFEKFLASSKFSPQSRVSAAVIWLEIGSLVLFIWIPVIVLNVFPDQFSMVGSTMVCGTYSVVFLKLWSYIQVNSWCREAAIAPGKRRRRRRSYSKGDKIMARRQERREEMENVRIVPYPDNLNVKDLLYFLFAPTLCYELNFPRSERIRKRFLLKRIAEVVVGFHVILGLFQQWIVPSVKNSLIPFSNMDLIHASERLLKLAIPNHLLWLVFFYLYFHGLMNIAGELLMFADRDFYGDWWNSPNVGYFWRTWNLPVHRWAVRHLYMPLTRCGWTKFHASLAVFVLSAFFHEYLVSVPLRIFQFWAFLGMMAQLPLAMVSNSVERVVGGRWGNILVWSSIILGQPLCIMMYFHDYIIKHFGHDLLDSFSQL